ncbi:hypothetical protein BX616_010487 [Lobosporangium transversale]|uniref:Uncharacterized protein n=1 Tax=Lobosporangium transversale TaxID=64571 RepID=A0A1Y2GBV9_9FUNG|nr:hypothetical protein BCR41DRAFT_425085 [Lobosporangium transversale]KAF9911704.1 hypothetical protein BX616_010487 [Lobosporangium transversale]ORZ06551.1 hypothetical protein BCR41DRAFT_425085 [Lobosporangium transversale]|eukprot:XP_021877594.1 hypothetical protein BCR41DRAFT_425085 [Lobosporangium transversale]
MAPLQTAKEWLRRRRGKNRKNAGNNNIPKPFVPGIGYPPQRNSSQPTLIPYVPPAAGSSSDIESETEQESNTESSTRTVPTHDMVSAATTTCLAISARSAALLEAHVPDEYADDFGRFGKEGQRLSSSDTTSTLVPPSFPLRPSSYQPPSLAKGALLPHNKQGSHTSLPAQMPLDKAGLMDLTSCPQFGPARHNLNWNSNHPVNRLMPEQKHLSKQFGASTETLVPLESRAQEYARSVKTLWQLMEEERIVQRLTEAAKRKSSESPKTTASPAPTPDVRLTSENTRARGGLARVEPKLTPIEEVVHPSEESQPVKEKQSKTVTFQHRQSCPLAATLYTEHGQIHLAESVDGQAQPVTTSLPNSPTVSPVVSASELELAKEARRSTLLSPTVIQSAKELQKRDHYTIQQRVDMEEDWRLKARLLQSASEHTDRAAGVRRIHEKLLARQRLQREQAIPEYEPTHKDFNRWFNLKEEIDDALVPDLINDDVRGFDLKEEFEYEDEKREREQREREEKKRREIEELEHELDILGLERFDGLCMSFVESDGPSEKTSDEQKEQQLPLTPEELEKQKQALQEQLQHHYQQLQLELQLQHHTLRSSNKGIRKKKFGPAIAGVAPPTTPNPNANNVTKPTAAATTTAATVPAKITLHEPRPLRPRNGRKLFSNENCDSMIINDTPIMTATAP